MIIRLNNKNDPCNDKVISVNISIDDVYISLFERQRI